jgi:hypothetical protein
MGNGNTEERDQMTDAVINIVQGDGPSMDNELAINVLVDALALVVAGSTMGKPDENIDEVSAVIEEMIKGGARRILERHASGLLAH